MNDGVNTACTKLLATKQRSQLTFEASYEISSLAAVLRKLIDDANLDGLGKACCGMLIRVEQLGEAISACVADTEESDETSRVQDLQQLILGRGASLDRRR